MDKEKVEPSIVAVTVKFDMSTGLTVNESFDFIRAAVKMLLAKNKSVNATYEEIGEGYGTAPTPNVIDESSVFIQVWPKE